jgi:hypothetical protein
MKAKFTRATLPGASGRLGIRFEPETFEEQLLLEQFGVAAPQITTADIEARGAASELRLCEDANSILQRRFADLEAQLMHVDKMWGEAVAENRRLRARLAELGEEVSPANPSKGRLCPRSVLRPGVAKQIAQRAAAHHQNDVDSKQWPPHWVITAVILGAHATACPLCHDDHEVMSPFESIEGPFLRCDTCARKPLATDLCASCFHNRAVINRIQRLFDAAKAVRARRLSDKVGLSPRDKEDLALLSWAVDNIARVFATGKDQEGTPT